MLESQRHGLKRKLLLALKSHLRRRILPAFATRDKTLFLHNLVEGFFASFVILVVANLDQFLNHGLDFFLFDFSLLVNPLEPSQFFFPLEPLLLRPFQLFPLFSLNFAPLDQLSDEVGEAHLQGLEHEGLRVGVPVNNEVQVFLRHRALQLREVPIVDQVAF